MKIDLPVIHSPCITPLQRLLAGSAIALLAMLVAGSMFASLFATFAAHTQMPSSDSWSPEQLIADAVQQRINWQALWQRHNDVHFIPLPRFVYAVDMGWFTGSGWCVAAVSWLMVAVSGMMWTLLIWHSPLAGCRARWLCLLPCWLLTGSAMQMESLLNPANLQWSCLAAGVSVTAAGLVTRLPALLRKALFGFGVLLSILSGAQWYLLVGALLVSHPSAARHTVRRLPVLLCAILLAIAWEILNSWVLHTTTPAIVLIYSQLYPFSDTDIRQYSDTVFAAPATVYLDWLQAITVFMADFMHPALERLLPAPAVMAVAMLTLTATFSAIVIHHRRDEPAHPAVFVFCFALLTAIAVAVLRAPLPGGYTPRFANIGMAMSCASLLLVHTGTQRHATGYCLTILATLIYCVLQTLAGIGEASQWINGGNHKRLSQIAYALDVQDIRTTAENPFGTTLQDDFVFLDQHKSILASSSRGVYATASYRIYHGAIPLPSTVVRCDYRDVHTSHHTDDVNTWYLQGSAIDPEGHAMPDVLLVADNTPVGYGIPYYAGDNLWQQWRNAISWAGFARFTGSAVTGSSPASVQVTAFNSSTRCQPATVALREVQ